MNTIQIVLIALFIYLGSIGSIVGMAFIMFVALLFSSLIGKIFSFVYNIVLELSYRVA